jgi:hypothetical protein
VSLWPLYIPVSSVYHVKQAAEQSQLRDRWHQRVTKVMISKRGNQPSDLISLFQSTCLCNSTHCQKIICYPATNNCWTEDKVGHILGWIELNCSKHCPLLVAIACYMLLVLSRPAFD